MPAGARRHRRHPLRRRPPLSAAVAPAPVEAPLGGAHDHLMRHVRRARVEPGPHPRTEPTSRDCGRLREIAVGSCGRLWGSAGDCGEVRGGMPAGGADCGRLREIAVGSCGRLWGNAGDCGGVWGGMPAGGAEPPRVEPALLRDGECMRRAGRERAHADPLEAFDRRGHVPGLPRAHAAGREVEWREPARRRLLAAVLPAVLVLGRASALATRLSAPSPPAQLAVVVEPPRVDLAVAQSGARMVPARGDADHSLAAKRLDPHGREPIYRVPLPKPAVLALPPRVDGAAVGERQ
mmetsp:Transcript_49505/g.165282  ORF Transcript_49505/g.165282 Transcript_49505/m.165282 type:complete len:293 (-) Transcript_49505:154-1032(-)